MTIHILLITHTYTQVTQLSVIITGVIVNKTNEHTQTQRKNKQQQTRRPLE